MYDTDDYGQIINGPNTFQAVAADLLQRDQVVLNWTDRRGTLHNILLAFGPTRIGTLGGVVGGGPGLLWVGVAGTGCVACPAGGGYLSWDYAAEKLGLKSQPTAEAIAELITGVREAIWGLIRAGK